MIYGAEGIIGLVNLIVLVGVLAVIAVIAGIVAIVGYRRSPRFRKSVLNNRLVYLVIVLGYLLIAAPIVFIAGAFLLLTIYLSITTNVDDRIESEKPPVTIKRWQPNIDIKEIEAKILNKPYQQQSLAMQKIYLKLSESGESFASRYPQLVDISRQPAGLNFYNINWDTYPRGEVKLEHGKYTFTVDNVLGVMGSQDMEAPLEGMYKLSVWSGLSNTPPLISHDEARLKTYALLRNIEQAGWQVITGRNDPRIKGKDRFNHVLSKSKYIGLGVDYVPTFEDWMRIEDLTSWNFYADHQYLTVYFKRERTLLDPAKSGSYLITYTLKSEAENFRGYVEPLERQRWKELLPAELAQDKDKRAKAEAALKAKGVAIDETYQDPPLPDLK